VRDDFSFEPDHEFGPINQPDEPCRAPNISGINPISQDNLGSRVKDSPC
jgi:hypothetical protein